MLLYVVNYCVYYYLFWFLNFNYIVSGSIGFGIGAVTGYICNRYWTFKSSISFIKGGLKYLLIQFLCLAVYLLTLSLVVNYLGISKLYSPYFGIFVTTFLNFFLSKRLLYAK